MFLQNIGPISSGRGQTVAGGSWADSASCTDNIKCNRCYISLGREGCLYRNKLFKRPSLLVVFRITCDLIMRSQIL